MRLRRRALLAGLWPLAHGARAAPVRFAFDPSQARLDFTVAALGLLDIPGRFERFQGELLLDLAAPERTRLAVEIDLASASMADPDRTVRLRGPDFFDVQNFPRARFDSQAARRLAADRIALEGMLALRGRVLPLVIELLVGERRAGSLGIEATGRLSRSAYGMVADRALLGDTVRLSLSLRVAAPGG
ncbi:YceI family protein [Roseomonas sp. USHLN139]|uniref:YceI family protein n=1 Tax=Roseomonas sp. USHLN139 TaxID=3081298 RepID=UPI003B0162F3